MDALPNSVDWLNRFGADAAPALVPCLDHESVGWAASICLWKWDPELACRRLMDPKALGAAARVRLLTNCPPDYIATVAQALVANPGLVDAPNLSVWAKDRLPTSGFAAEYLLSILRWTIAK